MAMVEGAIALEYDIDINIAHLTNRLIKRVLFLLSHITNVAVDLNLITIPVTRFKYVVELFIRKP